MVYLESEVGVVHGYDRKPFLAGNGNEAVFTFRGFYLMVSSCDPSVRTVLVWDGGGGATPPQECRSVPNGGGGGGW